ncbi:transposase [Myxococcus dinghuensis]|uniref:transposase n=1 Tax=Myxococcus dinghuensis TaxID=2906761 RepID=UPI0038994734
MRRHELSDAQWNHIKPVLGSRTGPPSRRGDRDFIDAVVWRVKTGVQWRDLPERFGNWKTSTIDSTVGRELGAGRPSSRIFSSTWM